MKYSDDFEKVTVGEVVCFFEGKNNKPVAYTPFGKVILCKHRIPLGYAIVKSVEDRGNYFLVTADHTIADIYSGINYEELLEVLPKFGFKIGYDTTFENNHYKHLEHQIFAYNLEYNVCIVAATFRNSDSDRFGFGSIDVYCPNLKFLEVSSNRFYSHGSGIFTVFDFAIAHSQKDLLQWLLDLMSDIKKERGVEWPENETIDLWNYSDSNYNENGEWDLWDKTINRVLMADSECLQIFKNSERFREAMRKEGVAI